MGRASNQPNAAERRANLRSSGENRATGLVQLILRDPKKAAEQLEDDLRRGADLEVVLGLLDAAQQAGEGRGETMAPLVRAIRSRILRRARTVKDRWSGSRT